jgi:hypothetical protein
MFYQADGTRQAKKAQKAILLKLRKISSQVSCRAAVQRWAESGKHISQQLSRVLVKSNIRWFYSFTWTRGLKLRRNIST